MIPTFRTDAEAAAHAERYKPFRAALARPNGPDYAATYGARAAAAAEQCRQAALAGNGHRLHLAMMALTLTLHRDCPRLYIRQDG